LDELVDVVLDDVSVGWFVGWGGYVVGVVVMLCDMVVGIDVDIGLRVLGIIVLVDSDVFVGAGLLLFVVLSCSIVFVVDELLGLWWVDDYEGCICLVRVCVWVENEVV